MDITDLQIPMGMDKQFSRFLSESINRPTDFGAANRSFASMISNPMMFMGPGGQVLDPSQTNAQAGTAYLGRRAGTENAANMQRDAFAQLLLGAGSNMGMLAALQKQLEASQMGGQGLFLGGLGL